MAAPATPTALADAATAATTSPATITGGEAVALEPAAATDGEARPADLPLLAVQGLKKHFPIYGGIMRRQIGTVYAVDGVDFEIIPG